MLLLKGSMLKDGGMMKKIYASLDIGTSSIKLIVGEVINTNIHVLFANILPSHGIKKGLILDEEAVKQDIQKLVQSAEDSLKVKITRVLLNIPANQSRIYSTVGSVQILSTDHTIRQSDVVKAIQKANRFEKKKNETIISTIPIKYHYNEQTTTQNPIGKEAYSLQVDVLVITTTKKVLYPYIRVVEGSQLEIMDICINAYSEAKEVLTDVNMEKGAVLVDVGHRSTTISFFEDNYLKYITMVNVGGYDLTKLIASTWKIPLAKAETYKVKYGSCHVEMKEQDLIHTNKVDNDLVHYTKYDLAMLLHEGVEDLMVKVKEKLSVLGDKDCPVFIVGGGAEIDGFANVATDVLEKTTLIYRPQVIGVRKMSYVASLGLIYYLVECNKIYGEIEPSIMVEEITNTMSLRFKGLTKSNTNTGEGKIKKLIDRFVADDSE